MNSPLNHLTKTISKPVRGAIGIRSLTILTVALGLFLAGCADTNPPLGQHTGATALQGKSCNPYCDTAPALTPSALKAVTEFRDAPQTQYQLGPGDSIGVTVWDHPELSGPRVVGPDGVIQVGLIGSVKVADLNADEAAKKLTAALSDDYVAPITSVQINTYNNNQVTVLGDVGNPGIIHFETQPTLLEALAKAGPGKEGAPATKCAIFRGKDRVMWLDLRPLFRGDDLAFNLPLHRNDVVYVAYTMDDVVYVLGQVSKPGAYPISPNMSLMEALAQAGGPTDNATPGKVTLARPSRGLQQTINIDAIEKGTGESNYALEAGDVVFVPKRGLAKVGYVLQQLNPLTQTLFFGAALF